MTIIIGIDPGSRITGYGVIQTSGNQHQHLASGSIVIRDLPLSERLEQIFQGISDIIHQYRPDEAAIENVFVQKNANSALKLGQARGAAMVAAAVAGLSVAEYSPRQIKQSVVGYGAALKPQVQQMIKAILNLNGPIQADAADALAVSITHAHSRTGLGQLTGTLRVRRGRLR